VSPTECFLRFLVIPDDETMSVDLRQSVVVILSHLDRLSEPYMPPQEPNKAGVLFMLKNECILNWAIFRFFMNMESNYNVVQLISFYIHCNADSVLLNVYSLNPVP
jgi:hypothetical protein